ncbi:uncharacterized protein CDAR_64111, partial [Caerostris darwini]
MTVMWSTFRQTETSMVEYGLSPDQLDSVANGTWQMLNNRGTHQYVHTVKLRGLLIDTQYHYRCGDGVHFSEVFSFRTLRKGTEWRPRVLIFGDLGFKDGASTPLLIEEARNGSVDLVLHNGQSSQHLFAFSVTAVIVTGSALAG